MNMMHALALGLPAAGQREEGAAPPADPETTDRVSGLPDPSVVRWELGETRVDLAELDRVFGGAGVWFDERPTPNRAQRREAERRARRRR